MLASLNPAELHTQLHIQDYIFVRKYRNWP
jgi:hypothetical protein